MRLVLALVLTALTATAQAALETLGFEHEIAGWHFFDQDGDERDDFLVYLRTPDGLRFVTARQKEDGSFVRGALTPLPDRSVVLALGRFGGSGGRDMAFVSPSGVSVVVPDGAGTRRRDDVIATESLFRAPTTDPPAFWHWDTDVDADGADDLFLPTDDGIAVFFGDGKGGFSEPVVIHIAGDRVVEETGTGLLSFVRSYPRPVFKDILGDTRLELAWFDEKGLVVIPQPKPRVFDAAGAVRVELPWIAGQEATGLLEQTDISLEEIVKGGRVALVLAKMRAQNGSVTNMRTTLVVLANRGGTTPFPTENASTALILKGVIGNGPSFADVDGDGVLDLITGTYAAGISDAISRLLNKVPITVHVYRGTKDPKEPFSSVPDFTTKIDVPSDDFEKWGARTSIGLDEDLTGDGICDLFLLGKSGDGREAVVRAGRKPKEGAWFEVSDDVHARTDASDIEDASLRKMSVGGRVGVIFETKTSLRIWRP